MSMTSYGWHFLVQVRRLYIVKYRKGKKGKIISDFPVLQCKRFQSIWRKRSSDFWYRWSIMTKLGIFVFKNLESEPFLSLNHTFMTDGSRQNYRMITELSRINSSFFYMLCVTSISTSMQKISRFPALSRTLWPKNSHADTLGSPPHV